MNQASSAVTESDWKYPEPDALLSEGWLAVGSGHKIYWHEYGNPEGAPVIFLHGGPGGGSKPKQARFFNPQRYRIILFDQRGCGRSTPNAADADPRVAKAALKANTTDDLIKDINKLCRHLRVTQPLHVFGGSWGSTLALAYAIKHPEMVKTLILRGIFLCRRKDLDYFYQGNAATPPGDPEPPGTYLGYPEAWAPFVKTIPAAERGDMVAAYSRIFNGESGAAKLEEAAAAWSVWEGATSSMSPPQDLSGYADPVFAKAFARIENHYFMIGAFLGGRTDRDTNYLLENVGKIAHLPIYVVQGRFDAVCPRFGADDLVTTLKKCNPSVQLSYQVTMAGHSAFERETALALTRIMDDLSYPVVRRVK